MTTTAWAIKAPDGEFIRINFYYEPELDMGDLEVGYRCVRVNITEVSE